MSGTQAPVQEACYCGTRWTVRPNGYRTCSHCDRPPTVKTFVGTVDGQPTFTYRCPRGCAPCATVNRRAWDR